MSDEVAEEWGKLKARIETVFEQHEQDQIRLPVSFGTKSLVLIFATLEVSSNFKVMHIESGRHSPTVLLHISNMISMLKDRDILVDSEHILCETTVSHRIVTGCPIMSSLIEIPPSTQDILASLNKVYKSPKINKQKEIFYKNKDRHFPMRHLTLQLISELYRLYVPSQYKFPVNSIATCNMPICPIAYDEYPPEILLKHKDWTSE